MKYKNNIIAELTITKNENKKIRIINSFENFKKEKALGDKEEDYKYKNEEEIKKCEITINDKIIRFSYYYTFNKEGKYHIKYIFSENLTKINYLFYKCNSLTNIDLSNLNTQNVTDMSFMFYGCKSLSNIDLSNFNTQNATNMSYMFSRCNSLLKKIKLN